MAEIYDNEFGIVKLIQRSNIRRVTIQIRSHNSILITAPHIASRNYISNFLENNRLQIRKVIEALNQQNNKYYTPQNPPPTRFYRWKLIRTRVNAPTMRFVGHIVHVSFPMHYQWEDRITQETLKAMLVDILRKEAHRYLPKRLTELSLKHGFQVKGLQIKRMKSRWGSCISGRKINLNLYLMLLPDHLIDHVIIHELCHSIIMNHGEEFHRLMKSINPRYRDLDRELKEYRIDY